MGTATARPWAQASRRRTVLDTPDWFRQEAEKCFFLADKIMDENASDALVTYGAELIARAERMEATLAAAVPKGRTSK